MNTNGDVIKTFAAAIKACAVHHACLHRTPNTLAPVQIDDVIWGVSEVLSSILEAIEASDARRRLAIITLVEVLAPDMSASQRALVEEMLCNPEDS